MSIKQLLTGKQSELIATVAMLLYFCSNAIDITFNFLLPVKIMEIPIATIFENIVLGILIILYYLLQFHHKKINVLHIYILVALFIMSSVYLHPEYSFWFNHEEYGFKKQFLPLTSGIYALLIVAMVHDKMRLASGLIYSARFNLFFYIVQLFNALRRGYWVSSISGHVEYSLAFGYRVAFCATVFLFLFMFNKKRIDLICFVISFFMVLIQGSRGAFLSILISGILIVVYKWQTVENNVVKFLLPWVLVIFSIFIMLVGLPVISSIVIGILTGLNIGGRTMRMLLANSITADSGRERIWTTSIDLIENGGLFGYGFYGDRYVIGRFLAFGYPHNFFLEVLIQFGLFIGSFLIVLLLWNVIKMGLKCNDISWNFIYLVLLSSCSKLLLSDSFWYFWPFWALIGVMCVWRQADQNPIVCKD